jgi:hypothetical protein
MSYVDESNDALVSPFEAAAELLVPALPVGSGSNDFAGNTGGSAGGGFVRGTDGFVEDTPANPPPSGGGVGVGFGRD